MPSAHLIRIGIPPTLLIFTAALRIILSPLNVVRSQFISVIFSVFALLRLPGDSFAIFTPGRGRTGTATNFTSIFSCPIHAKFI